MWAVLRAKTAQTGQLLLASLTPSPSSMHTLTYKKQDTQLGPLGLFSLTWLPRGQNHLGFQDFCATA